MNPPEIPSEMKRKDVDSESDKSAPVVQFAKVYQWNGQDLFPFSAARHCALQRLQVADSPYEGAAATIRLCQMTPGEICRIRGANVPKFLEELGEWMERENIGFGDKNGRQDRTDEAVRIYNEMFNDLFEATSLEPEGGGSGNA